MPFELPDNLHPDCGPVAWLLGTWRGNGHGDYPTIEPFQFGQELIFTHDGRPFFHYCRAPGSSTRTARRSATPPIETGFLRCRPEGKLELLLAHNTGFAEIWYGKAEGGKLELVTDAVVRTESRQGGRRGQAPLRQRRGRPALRLRHGGDGPGAAAAPVGAAEARSDDGHERGLARELRGSGYRLTPQRELVLDAVETARPRHPRRGARRGPEAVVGGQRLDGLPHPRGARGARPGAARAPHRPRPDVPLRRRPRALPPGLPELSAGHVR